MQGISQIIASDRVQGSDIKLTSTGDILTTSDDAYTQQRILRRLMTVPGSYIWHPGYGAGLPRYIGKPLTDDLFKEIQSLIVSQVLLEETVAKIPEPQITLTSLPYNLFGSIVYYDATTNTSRTLSFNFQR